MDKKSIINDLYQVAVIRAFAIGYSMLGKKNSENDISKHSEVRSGRHGKVGCYCHCVRDDKRVSHQTEDPTGAH